MNFRNWIQDWKSAIAENFFLRTLSTVLAVAVILLTFLAFGKRDRIIIAVPQMTKDFWLDQDKASHEYIEQQAVFISELAGNLNPTSASYNIKQLVKYYLTDNARDSVKGSLEEQAAYVRKNNITQNFYPAGVTNYDEKTNSIDVNGLLEIRIDKSKVSSEKAVWHMRFRLADYALRIEEMSLETQKEQGNKKPKGDDDE